MRTTLETLFGTMTPLDTTTHDLTSILAHTSLSTKPPITDAEMLAALEIATCIHDQGYSHLVPPHLAEQRLDPSEDRKAPLTSDATTSMEYGDFRLRADEEDIHAAETRPLSDPDSIVHMPSRWQRYANSSMNHYRNLLALLTEYYLDEANAVPAKGPTRPMRVGAKKEAQALISILGELLMPDPNTYETSTNITCAAHKLRETLLVSWARTHMSWEAAIEFAKMVKDVQPGEDANYDDLLRTAGELYPLDHKETTNDGPPPPPPTPQNPFSFSLFFCLSFLS